VDSTFQNFLNEFVMMWVLIDPIGTVPVFLMVTASLKEEHRRMIATRAVLVSGVILLAFLFGGHLLLRALGIPLPSFQIAGGIVLFLFALTMIFGPSKEEQQKEESSVSALERAKSIAVFPARDPLDREPRCNARRGASQRQRAASAREHHPRRGGDRAGAQHHAGLHVLGEADTPRHRRLRRQCAQPHHGPDPRRRLAVDSVLSAVAQYFKLTGLSSGGLL
jgi:hypothetical protein